MVFDRLSIDSAIFQRKEYRGANSGPVLIIMVLIVEELTACSIPLNEPGYIQQSRLLH